LDNIGLEALARERAGGELEVERKLVNRLAQSFRALPRFVGKKPHFCHPSS